MHPFFVDVQAAEKFKAADSGSAARAPAKDKAAVAAPIEEDDEEVMCMPIHNSNFAVA